MMIKIEQMTRSILTIVFLLSVTFTQAQPASMNQSVLQIEDIMQGEQFVGFLPRNLQWSANGNKLYFSWNPTADTLWSTFKTGIDEKGELLQPELVSWEEESQIVGRGTYNKAKTQKVYVSNGDLFLYDHNKESRFQITNTLERESNPFFSGDESKIIYRKGANLFAWNRTDGSTRQLTDFKKGFKKRVDGKTEQDAWLEEDQLNMFDILAHRKATDAARKRQREERKVQRPKTYYHGEKSISNLTMHPDGDFITFRLLERGKSKRTDVPNYVTPSGRVERIDARPKVGVSPDQTELGIYDVKNDTVFIVDPTQIEGIFDKPAFLKEYHTGKEAYEGKYKHPRAVVFHGPYYSEDGKALLSAKSQDNKDRWLFLLSLEDGQLKLLERQHDDAWIGGPGISGWNFSAGNIGWMPDNQHIWFQSEETGYSHLYTLNVATGEKRALTKGDFEILDVTLSKDEQSFYITSNKETPFEHHFYKMPIEGGKLEKITSRSGNHQVTMSPDEKWLAIRYSSSNQPWEVYLMKNEPGAPMQRVTQSTTEAFKAYPWRTPEIIHFTASDGVKVPARLYRPAASQRNGAAVIFVHGAGYLQNVHRWWSSYYREFMFHNILADNGFTVLDIDYRGSNGYGRDWRTAIYRFMGGNDLSDQVDGAKYLTESHGIDADRIGIYGGSYGGFITLMGLFTSPGTFKSGAALRSVTDWAHYNHGYTSNILNTPVQDSIAFRKSSPIYHADGLEDNLLILHGMIDDNVQFQDVVRLAQRLIELGKDDWEFAVFPLERHGFVEPSSWADEYKRIYKLFWKTLRE